MANDDTPAGFLSRWSRRKADVREGRPLAEPALSPSVTGPANAPALTPNAAASAPGAPTSSASLPEPKTEPVAKPVPTLADTQQLTPESDFTDFMSRGVAPDVKNAAMKKLFADPHFNVMDRMDVYIDDYSQSDPLPMAMLRQMASAQTLGLFDDALETAAKPHTEDASSPMSIKSDAPPSSESDPSNDPTVSDSGEHQDIE